MGVTLDLRLIDHQRIAVAGLQAVNHAIRDHNPEILRAYLRGLPIEVDSSLVEERQARLAKLRELKAPKVIIQNEGRFLRQANGEAYRPEEYQNAPLDELRQLLGSWCWITYSYSLDKAWDELWWFLEPTAGTDDSPLFPIRPPLGDPKQSVFGKALQGTMPYPTDALGDPVIRTLGSQEAGCSGYNPPQVCQEILAALQRVDSSSWEEHVPFRCELYRRAMPGMEGDDVAVFVEDELARAKDVFAALRSVYAKANERQFGVSCEYSL